MRSLIYKDYKKLLNDDNGIHLKQQLFLEKYAKDNHNKLKYFLLYHGIGTGKTRSSIIMAEEIMKKDKKKTVTVVLPARLKTNYLDELIPIICKYKIKELQEYNDIKTTELRKKKLRAIFKKIIDVKYSIYSYEYVVNLFKKSTDIKKTLKDFIDNKIIIIDEFHNLIGNNIDKQILLKIHQKNKIVKSPKHINSVLLRYITTFASEVSSNFNMIFLTATPVFDNFNQFVELIYLLNPKAERIIKKDDNFENIIFDDKKDKVFRTLIQFLKGLVSYYFITNVKDFPKVKYAVEEIPLSKTQDDKTSIIIAEENPNSKDERMSNLFLIGQRQVSISTFDYSEVDKVLGNLKEYAPKLKRLFELIDELKGKHVVYSNFIGYCLNVIKKYLEKNGWVNYTDEYKTKPYKTYVLWDATLNDNDKQNVKSILNSVENMDGKFIRVVLGSPSIKEGISFKHCQHLHQIDPVWNPSAKEQIEGRCIRYQSHSDIPLDHPFLKREVIVHNYKSIPRKGGVVMETCDQRIYDIIIPRKTKLLKKINNGLKKIAIDHYLYKSSSKSSPKIKSFTNSISIDSKEDIVELVKKRREIHIKTTCPKPRRPVDGKCPDNFEIRLNPQKFECCYKKKKKECPEGKVLNPKTGRCIKIKKEKKKECPEGKVLNPKTGRCIKIKK
uniref:Helicase ATP-binding domain-containing protein n=1 Tax=viral metagenome TaxID=1070528 RepID=A0A6C0CH94_9ZZZZ